MAASSHWAQAPSDLRRQNRIVLEGWTILRFTWTQVTTEPELVAAEIRLAIARRERLIRS